MIYLLRVLFVFVFVAVPFVAVGQDADVGADVGSDAEAKELSLQWPLECTVFEDCFIKHYPDLRAGTNRAVPVDYKCGRRTVPGLAGTTIVFQDHSTTRNQPVLAMAAGRVMFIRDDLSGNRRYPIQSRKACGNYVQVRHSSTHSTKYCHLRQGTVGVEVGERVEAGAQLGQVGSSGAAEHPQLQVKVLENGNPVDPFTGRDVSSPSECFSAADEQMWAQDIPYPDAGVMSASFTLGAPPSNDIAFNATPTEVLPAEVSPISVWIRVYGVKKGDREQIVIKTPDGEAWHEHKRYHPVSANFWTAMTTVRPTAPLEPGTWQAVYTLQRAGDVVVEHTFEVEVN